MVQDDVYPVYIYASKRHECSFYTRFQLLPDLILTDQHYSVIAVIFLFKIYILSNT